MPVMRSDTATPTFTGPAPGCAVRHAGHAHETEIAWIIAS